MAGPSQIIAWQCEQLHAHTYDVLDGATQVVSEKQQSAPQSRSRSRSRPTTRWRNQYGGMKADDARRLRELERENARLGRIVADKELEIDALKEIARGNW